MSVRIEASDLQVVDEGERRDLSARAGAPPPLHPTECIHGRMEMVVDDGAPMPLDEASMRGDACLRAWVRRLRAAHTQLEDDAYEGEDALLDPAFVVFWRRGARAFVRDARSGAQVTCDAAALREAIARFLAALEQRITEAHPQGAAWWRDVCARSEADHE